MRIGRIQGAQAQQRAAGRDVGLVQEGGQLPLGAGLEYALAVDDEGLFRLADPRGGLLQLGVRRLGDGDITADEIAVLRDEFRVAGLRVLGEVEDHGSRASAAGDIESAGHGPGYVLGTADLVTPFGDRGGHADQVGLLEGVGAQQGRTDLSGHDDDRSRIDHRVRHAGDDIGPAGAGGDHDETGHPLDPGIALRRVDGALLVPHQDMAQPVQVVIQAVIDRHDGSAGITEHGVDPLEEDLLEEDFTSADPLSLLVAHGLSLL